MSKIIVGLDIGTTKIACFVGKKNEHGKIEVLSMGKTESFGVMRGMVSNIDKTVESIKGAIIEAEERIDGTLKIDTVNVGIAGQHIKSIQHRGILTRDNIDTEISQKDIDKLIEDMYKLAMPPGEKIITVLPQEYIIDNEQGIKDPIGMAGVRLEANFHIITGNIGASMNIHKCVERAGLSVKNIILEPIASADAVLTDEEKEAGVVLVDIGGGTTDVAIFHEGIIRHTAVIPFGGNAITEDIKEGCTIMRSKAEQVKQQFGSAIASESQENVVVAIPGLKGRPAREITLRNLASIIQARMEEIIELVHFEIKNSGYEKKLIGGIVVTGGGSQLDHISQLFEYVTGKDTRLGYPTEHLANTNNEAIKSPMYATGVGLVLKGFEDLAKVEAAEPEAASTGSVKTHSEKTRGSFFDKIIKKGIGWFDEVEEEEGS
ncbi:MAG: cell division protein FtsA [Fluviicola sp.]|nr:cell division protein FtsA [Fluviicola sp.]